ncbi:DUF4241 domain-containing protein [Mucispirillum schaedleri]|uniref:DUF4241 domain-containing protein n=1 Tax=Mucispirillum schaedleri TaxID=248039 RepID=UPI001F58B554|nr:DUF4241 domain-containing protein [Mucispirillum schaedleri]
MKVNKEWLEVYNKKKSIMCPENSLEKYFTDKKIAGCKIDTLELGNIKITSGEIVACDPTACLDNGVSPFFDIFPKGEFPVTASIVVDEEEEMASSIALVRIKFTDNVPVSYREALYGDEDLSEIENQGDFFGIIVDTGLACFIDRDGYNVLAEELTKREEADEDFDAYTDIYSIELEKSAKKHPKYQYPDGDWVNYSVNEKNNAVLFSSPYGEGYYPVYVAEDKDGNICQLVIQFIDVELSDDEDDE